MNAATHLSWLPGFALECLDHVRALLVDEDETLREQARQILRWHGVIKT